MPVSAVILQLEHVSGDKHANHRDPNVTGDQEAVEARLKILIIPKLPVED
jgi:hypothetical protein